MDFAKIHLYCVLFILGRSVLCPVCCRFCEDRYLSCPLLIVCRSFAVVFFVDSVETRYMPCPLRVLSCPMSALLLLFFVVVVVFLSDVDFVKGSIRHVRFIPPVKVSVDPVHFGFYG